jgi:hypothetical protein
MMRPHLSSAVLRAFIAACVLAGCSAVPVPQTIWLRLSADPPGLPASTSTNTASAASTTTSASTANAAASREIWQLMLPVPLPAHLDRDSLFMPQGAGGAVLRPLAHARWIEPLRDALPRVLREDLVRERRQRDAGAALWTTPLPAGIVPTRQLRVEITTFEIAADGRTLALRARWSIADASGAQPAALHEAAFGTPVAGSDGAATVDAPDAWALAHRAAIATLAARIAATMAGS